MTTDQVNNIIMAKTQKKVFDLIMNGYSDEQIKIFSEGVAFAVSLMVDEVIKRFERENEEKHKKAISAAKDAGFRLV